jgi:tRNA uridine 5-carboxymethylaminomethyl modification enzyme
VLPVHNEALAEYGTSPVETRLSLFSLLKRPEMGVDSLEALSTKLGLGLSISADPKVREQIALAGAYEGYIQRQQRLADRAERLEEMRIPANFDYASMSLSHETLEKLGKVRPTTVGQASRVPGVRPSDIALIIGFLRAGNRRKVAS